jgi:putative addiction module component (TIGR02574 family)
MSASPETVEAAALQLTTEERAELIERLIDTVLPPPLQPAWEAEIARRIRQIDAGEVECLPWGTVMADLRAKLDRCS